MDTKKVVKRFFAVVVLAFLVTFIILLMRIPNEEQTLEQEKALDDIYIPGKESEIVDSQSDPGISTEPEIEETPIEISSVILDDTELTPELTEIVKKFNVVGISIVVIENGAVTHSYSYGTSDSERSVPFTSSSFIRVAGASEMVSAIGVMKLYEQNVVDIDASIGDYLGYEVKNPHNEKIITLRQLMTHSATISDYGKYNDVINKKCNYVSLKDMLSGKFASSNFYESTPGKKYSFSNFGAALLGPVVSAASGMAFDDYMDLVLFYPLRIDASFFSTGIDSRSDIATIFKSGDVNYILSEMDSFSAELSEISPTDNYRISHANLYINAAGMSRILRMFLGYGSVDGVTVLSEDTVRKMISSSAEGSLSRDVGNGFSIKINTTVVPGRTLYGHQGSAYGATTEVFWDYSDKSGIVILCNGSNNGVDSDNFSNMGKAIIREVYNNIIE